ncbi:MAG: hypothetical protein VX905_04795 [Actinomycetota bacterium]|nr:hypothetical protein [Actinomycetota bacterium]
MGRVVMVGPVVVLVGRVVMVGPVVVLVGRVVMVVTGAGRDHPTVAVEVPT